MKNVVDQEENTMRNKLKVFLSMITALETSEDIESKLKNSQFMK